MYAIITVNDTYNSIIIINVELLLEDGGGEMGEAGSVSKAKEPVRLHGPPNVCTSQKPCVTLCVP